MNPPLVTVIMNCLNGEEFLRPALDSVFAQRFEDWEIVFWDNCSNDQSGEIARSYGDRIRIFRGDRVIPLSAGRQCASQRALGKYLALLDTDDLWHPDFLSATVARLENNPACAIVWTDAWQIGADGARLRRYSQFTPFYRGFQFERLLREQFISPSSAMVFRAEAVRDVGGWDADFTMMADAELLLRLASCYQIDFCPEALSSWRSHGSNASDRIIQCWQEWKALLRKWRTPPRRHLAPAAAYGQYALRINLKLAVAAFRWSGYGEVVKSLARAGAIVARHPSLALAIPSMARNHFPMDRRRFRPQSAR